jgi:alpha-glucosidase
MCYPFEMLQPKRLTADGLAETFARMQAAAPDAWPCWSYSNHDTVRHITRWALSEAAAKAYTTLLICLRGSLCLYQGEELGLPEAELEQSELQDPYGIQFWPEFKGRDGARTPMVWVTDNAHGGFSAARPWLPVKAPHLPLSVAAQAADPASILGHYRRALAFRRANPVLRTGAMTDLQASGGVASFQRRGEAELFCAFNLSDETQELAMPSGTWQAIGAELGAVTPEAGRVTLGPWAVCLAQRA